MEVVAQSAAHSDVLKVLAAAHLAKQTVALVVDATAGAPVSLRVSEGTIRGTTAALTYLASVAGTSFSHAQVDVLAWDERVLARAVAAARAGAKDAAPALAAALTTAQTALGTVIAAGVVPAEASWAFVAAAVAADVLAAPASAASEAAPALHAFASTPISGAAWWKAAQLQQTKGGVAGAKAAAAGAASAAPAADGGKKAAGTGKKEKAAAAATGDAAGAAAAAAGGAGTGGAAAAAAAPAKKAAVAAALDVSSLASGVPIAPTDVATLTRPVQAILQAHFTSAMHVAFPAAKEIGLDADVVVNGLPKFYHHYQCNSALQLAGKLRGKPGAPTNPRAAGEALMAAVLAHEPKCPAIGKLEVAGSGFINIYLATDFVAARAMAYLTKGVTAPPNAAPRRVLVDYSSPNIAKEMHIGHLRSTIIGDTIARILEFSGHDVERVNHVGDWGTQFGMLIAHLKDLIAEGVNVDVGIGDLTSFYKKAKQRFDADAEFKARAHREVVALQAGDETNRALWLKMIEISQKMYDEVYARLDVDKRLLLRGESFYNDKIPAVVEEMTARGLAVESEGALVVHVPGKSVPLMLRKGDGGFGYDSTDLAAIHYRLHTSKRDWLVYVVDSGQALHFDLVFEGAKMAGWYDPAIHRVEHVGFGVIQGADRQKYKTRSGETVRLVDVLDEAKARAKAQLMERKAAAAATSAAAAAGGAAPAAAAPVVVDDAAMDHTAAVLGYGGVKYFDLRLNRTSDYVFDYDRMLSPDGDTAVYLEYAHARMKSILTKAREAHGVNVDAVVAAGATEGIKITHATELALLTEALRFPEIIRHIEGDLLPHHLAEFLFQLANRTAEFHRDCYVLASTTPVDVRDARLRIVTVVAAVIAKAMQLLGLTPLDRI